MALDWFKLLTTAVAIGAFVFALYRHHMKQMTAKFEEVNARLKEAKKEAKKDREAGFREAKTEREAMRDEMKADWAEVRADVKEVNSKVSMLVGRTAYIEGLLEGRWRDPFRHTGRSRGRTAHRKRVANQSVPETEREADGEDDLAVSSKRDK